MTVPRSLLALALSLLVGCAISGLAGPAGGPYPDACDSFGFSPRRCAAVVARGEREAGIRADEATSVEILPPVRDGSVSLGGRMIAQVRFRFDISGERTVDVWCVGVGSAGDLACADDPQIGISGGVDHDVPCNGEAPDGCATPPPEPRPRSVAAARPLDIAVFDIPLDHVGKYEIEVGRAGLPDGVLSVRSASLADTRPESFWLADVIRIEVRPDDPDRPPIGSVYRDPFDGVEPVTVFLDFEVSELSPGAVLQVRDLVVE